MRCDLFCHVVDNFGDIGVCWRLASQLARRGTPVRLWVDDASALRWMAPGHARTDPDVELRDWARAERDDALPGEVVIEAFGCDPPAPFVARMAARQAGGGPAPLWINLEYLSAESQAERNHLLPSPQFAGPGAGLEKIFFYPGFDEGTGGLLREPDLLQRQAAFDAPAWLAAHGIALQPGERAVSLFCYAGSPVDSLVERLAAGNQPTLLLATAGSASQAVDALLGPSLRRGTLRALRLPWLSQRDYDHLLWSCALNFVRGEDSAVRAQWAGRPFVWQLYRQSDGADRRKAQAFLDRFLEPPTPAVLAADLRQLWQAWHATLPLPAHWPAMAAWTAHCAAWRDRLAAQPDLVSRLQGLFRSRLK